MSSSISDAISQQGRTPGNDSEAPPKKRRKKSNIDTKSLKTEFWFVG